MQTSIGVFISNTKGQWLLGHATGQKHWDIFKGLPDPHELPTQTALRELREETGLNLNETQLNDTGIHMYRPGKQLHVYTVVLDSIDASALRCTSSFLHPLTGKPTMEMDAFQWFTPEDAKTKAVPRLWSVLASLSSPQNSPSL